MPPASLLIVAMLAVSPGMGSATVAPDGVTPAERLSLHPGLATRLLALALGESTRLEAWPIELGRRGDVLLTRHDVYAPGAEILVMDGDASRMVPRSNFAFLFGEVAGDDPTRVLLTIDPEKMNVHSFAGTSEGWTELRPLAEEGPDEYLLAPVRGFLDPAMERPRFSCEAERSGLARGTPVLPQSTESGSAAPTALRRMTLAVDTDNELMSLKFSDNTTNATNYIATLVALMSVAYERDLEVRLLQGTTFLRVSTTPDPYMQSGTGSADSAKLTEFRNYWQANHAGVSRGAAMMLSGKQSSPDSASGIAYLDSLCSTNRGYSFSQVFRYNGSNAASDTLLVAHEIGHNFGSDHTHCYLDPTPIDTCYNGESGCYSGPTSCPAPQTINGVTNVRGTVMSYCDEISGCPVATVFHPRTVEILDPIVASKEGVCVFPVAGTNPKEASPAGTMTAQRLTSATVSVGYTPACGATQHTVYAGNLNTLRTGGLSWNQRYCSLGASGGLSFTPSGNVYFVVAGNNGTIEGSYGQRTGGERPAAGGGGACSYTQDLSGVCP